MEPVVEQASRVFAHLDAGELDRAREALAAARALDATHPNVISAGARLDAKDGQRDRAMATLREALVGRPGDFALVKAVADLLVEGGEPDAAIAACADARAATTELWPDEVIAQICLDRHDGAGVLAAVEAGVARCPKEDDLVLLDAVERMIAGAIERGELDLAERGLVWFAEREPDAARLLTTLRVLRAEGPLWEACAAFDRDGFAGSPIGVALVEIMARRLEAHGSDRALALAFRLYDRVRYDDYARRFAGRARRLARRLAESERDIIKRAGALLVSRLQWKLHANGDDLEALISIAQIAQYSDEVAAQAAISRALELAPGERAVVKLGLRAFSEHDLARAVAIAHQYGVVHPDDPRMYVELGRCAARGRHTDAALDAYRIAAERGSKRGARELIEVAEKAGRWTAYPEADRARWTELAKEPAPAASEPAPPADAEPDAPAPPAPTEPAIAAGSIVKAAYTLRAGVTLEAGTGFVTRLADAGPVLLVTAQHVFGPPGGEPRAIPPADMPGEVTGARLVDAFDAEPVATTGRAFQVPYASHDARGDLAAFPITDASRARPLAMAAEPPSYGDRIWLAARLRDGAPAGRRIHAGSVYSSSDEPLEVVFEESALVLNGASGAPFVDVHGRVVGLLVRFSNRYDGKLIGHALNLDTIRGMLGDALDPDAAKEPRMQRRFAMSLHIKTVASLTEHQASSLLVGQDMDTGEQVKFIPSDALQAELTYPLETPHYVDIAADPLLSIGHVIWRIAQGYVEVYEDPRRFGVWGHGMEDLYFERLEIAGGKITVGVGS